MVLITPVLNVNKLLYPIRIDSVYIKLQELNQYNNTPKSERDSANLFLYSPQQLGINYSNLTFTMNDGVRINGWLVADTGRLDAPLLLIIPDIEEGALHYINAMREFEQRGLNVCVIDTRGQGMSEGDYYDPGGLSVSDINLIVQELKSFSFVTHIAVMGSGTGAGIIISAAYDSSMIADVLIFQNPRKSLKSVFIEHAHNEWGSIVNPFMNVLLRDYEKQTGIDFSECDYINMIGEIYIPHLMVAANYFSEKRVVETVEIYKSSNYYRKRFLIDKNSFNKLPGFNNSKFYYDNISAFINSSIPQKNKKSKFRKLALN